MTERRTQDAILDAAVACFGRLGYKKASAELIAKRAGVGKGTLYLYCESKQDLFYQAVHRELRDWMGELSRRSDPRVPATELLLQLAIAHVEFVEKRPLVRDLMFGALHGLLPEWAERFEELRALGRKLVADLLALGIRQGLFAADLDVEATAEILQEMHISATLLSHRTRAETDAVRRKQLAAFRLVMKGLEAR